ncbi:hypothetical protein [Cyclobacterium jeungdonense]|uniref:Membrane metalloprotease n=1 Tax=Cyclobacterium jeungdonense TaxID=708087 RepID=A0ABT8C5X0_9BACT|nr:hypothetical protein [Cyclobacterium jeungdonense]MDN3688189.1 hypothetical protein [Cyclobacterium jeungdonense]
MKILFRKLAFYGLLIGVFFSCSVPEREDPFVGMAAARWDVGKSATFLLSDDRFSNLELEVVYMKGYKPTDYLMESMVEFLQETTLKPGGIEIIEREIPAEGEEFYSTEDIGNLEDRYRESYNDGNTVSVFFLVVDGSYMQNEEEFFTIGAAYRNTSMVLFGKRIAENSGGLGRPSRGTLETTVALHELGHLLGLVNVGSEMVTPHEDQGKEYHCDNDSCLMYWTVETDNVLRFTPQTIPTLDENCRNDLRGNGGR